MIFIFPWINQMAKNNNKIINKNNIKVSALCPYQLKKNLNQTFNLKENNKISKYKRWKFREISIKRTASIKMMK